ncbi:MAG TPA: phosphate ABC transporter substrate-binding protein [Anaeromyxobacter sp.]
MRALAIQILATVLTVPAATLARETVRYGGSSTIAHTVLERGFLDAFRARTGVAVEIVDRSGTGRGLEALAAGRLDVTGAGRPLTAAERKAGLVGTVVAHDALSVYVNRTNPIKDLTRAQLREILSGKVTSWKQLGGRDVKIVLLVEPVASQRATVHLLRELVLEGGAFAPEARELELITDQLAVVSRTEAAVCVASVAYLGSVEPDVRDGVRPISLEGKAPTDANIRSGAYLLSRPMLLVTRGSPAGAAKALVDYVLSRDGQAVVERFFVPVATR